MAVAIIALFIVFALAGFGILLISMVSSMMTFFGGESILEEEIENNSKKEKI